MTSGWKTLWCSARQVLAIVLLGLLLAQPAPADELPGNSGWYYRLGGANPLVQRPATNTVVRVPLRFSLDFSLGRSCGVFDPEVALRTSFEQLRNLPQQAEQALMGAASAAIAGLPMYVLQRIDPGLYELLQNWKKKFEELIQIAFKNCQQIQSEIAAGKNPYEELVQISVGDDWKAAMGTSGLSILDEQQQIEAHRGENGVGWTDGTRAGGVNQPPVRIVGDVTEAGYGALVTGTTTAGASAPADTALGELWGSAGAARTFANEVLGEIEVTTCDPSKSGCPQPQTQAAHGLMPWLTKETGTVRAALTGLLVRTNGQFQPADLKDISAPGLDLGPEIITRLQRREAPERAILAGRLAGEIATQRALERALMLRRLLYAGRKSPAVASNGPAAREIDRAIAELEREIDSMRYEAAVRREIGGATAAAILATDESGRGSSASRPAPAILDPDRSTVR